MKRASVDSATGHGQSNFNSCDSQAAFFCRTLSRGVACAWIQSFVGRMG